MDIQYFVFLLKMAGHLCLRSRFTHSTTFGTIISLFRAHFFKKETIRYTPVFVMIFTDDIPCIKYFSSLHWLTKVFCAPKLALSYDRVLFLHPRHDVMVTNPLLHFEKCRLRTHDKAESNRRRVWAGEEQTFVLFCKIYDWVRYSWGVHVKVVRSNIFTLFVVLKLSFVGLCQGM